MKRSLLGLMILLLICLINCGPTENREVIEIQYTIIEETTFLDIKTSIDIRLKAEVEEEVLARIANKLRRDGRNKYERVFICYYLPGMEVNAGAWATSHFNPNLEVRILGR